LDLTRKISELESHLILERNLKSNMESQMQKLSTENVDLNEQCKAESDMHDKIRRLERELSKKEGECVRLTEDLERCKQNFNQVRLHKF
jgi:predicted RNase H-like nuclease (RuvC/YqgF family)